MSSLYTTKSLGRSWLPSPVHSNKRARYGTWSRDPPKLRWSSTCPQEPKRWSKIYERFALLAAVAFGTWWCIFGNTEFFSRTTFHLPWSYTSLNEMSNFAYVPYASNTEDLCSSLMQLESLHRVGAKADRVLLYPDFWTISGDNNEAHLLRQAREIYGAVLHSVVAPQQYVPVAVLASYQTTYERVIALDRDSTILRSMDEVFFSESLERGDGAAVMLSPSRSLSKAFQNAGNLGDMVAKHSRRIPRILQTTALRQTDHSAHSSSSHSNNSWSAKTAFGDSYMVQWKPMLGDQRETLRATCLEQDQPCEEREVWQWLYNDFRTRRKTVCGEQSNEWDTQAALDEANRRIIPLLDRTNGKGANSGAV